MDVSEIQAKGLTKLLAVTGTVPDKLKIHISEIEAGTRSHPPHQHPGTEAFYLFEGNVTVELEAQRHPLNPNEVMVIDATHMHGLFNSGKTKAKYMVIIAL